MASETGRDRAEGQAQGKPPAETETGEREEPKDRRVSPGEPGPARSFRGSQPGRLPCTHLRALRVRVARLSCVFTHGHTGEGVPVPVCAAHTVSSLRLTHALPFPPSLPLPPSSAPKTTAALRPGSC